MIREVVLYPNKVLAKATKKVVKIDQKTKENLADLKETLENCQNGVGLAAPQIGISKRFLGIKNTKTKEVEVYINPKIDVTFGEKVYPEIEGKDGKPEIFLEGCLSFPNYFGEVKRYLKIEVSFQKLEEEKLVDKRKTMVGFEAIVFQHELDHLEGILLVDRVTKGKGKFYKQIGEKMEEVSVF
jgi:peptide deformylase